MVRCVIVHYSNLTSRGQLSFTWIVMRRCRKQDNILFLVHEELISVDVAEMFISLLLDAFTDLYSCKGVCNLAFTCTLYIILVDRFISFVLLSLTFC